MMNLDEMEQKILNGGQISKADSLRLVRAVKYAKHCAWKYVRDGELAAINEFLGLEADDLTGLEGADGD